MIRICMRQITLRSFHKLITKFTEVFIEKERKEVDLNNREVDDRVYSIYLIDRGRKNRLRINQKIEKERKKKRKQKQKRKQTIPNWGISPKELSQCYHILDLLFTENLHR